jgi:hypothetical protein
MECWNSGYTDVSGGILANWMLAIHASYDDDLYSRVLRASAS